MTHILVVDDEASITILLQMYLEEKGYRVSTACDGVEALERYDADPADAVVTDLTMPRMTGRELIDRLWQRRPGIPTIVVTGWSGAEDLTNLHTCVMHKPVSLELLCSRLAEVLAYGESHAARPGA